eukprot:1142111-Pelagomonas_calceolata.AAC.3
MLAKQDLYWGCQAFQPGNLAPFVYPLAGSGHGSGPADEIHFTAADNSSSPKALFASAKLPLTQTLKLTGLAHLYREHTKNRLSGASVDPFEILLSASCVSSPDVRQPTALSCHPLHSANANQASFCVVCNHAGQALSVIALLAAAVTAGHRWLRGFGQLPAVQLLAVSLKDVGQLVCVLRGCRGKTVGCEEGRWLCLLGKDDCECGQGGKHSARDPVIACHNSVGSAAEQLNGSCSQLRSSNVDIPAQQARPFMLALLLPDLQDVTII